jgi:hypothetical protein
MRSSYGKRGLDRFMVRRPTQSAQSKDQMTFSWMESDPSGMPTAARVFLDEVGSDQRHRTHFLISCGEHKQLTVAPAAELYTSPRFRLSVQLPQRLCVPFSVLSAKHGLLDPEKLVEPYDLNFASRSREEKRVWAENVLSQLVAAHSNVERFVFLADDDYREYLVPLLLQRKFKILEPLQRT